MLLFLHLFQSTQKVFHKHFASEGLQTNLLTTRFYDEIVK